jgi:hypothetical protein
LFDERPEFAAAMNDYRQMSALVGPLRRAATGGGDIEAALRELQIQADKFPPRKSHLMALEFYLSDILDGPVSEWLRSAGRATNYVELLDQIERTASDNRHLFVTFNYDRMLESAFADLVGLQLSGSDLDSYIGRNFAVIKPHGSVDWAQYVTGEEPLTGLRNSRYTVSSMINDAPGLNFQDGIIALRPGRENIAFPQAWHPAIAIPLDRAKKFVCPPSHLERLSRDLEQVTHILIVGWRANEQHFLELLRKRLSKAWSLHLCIVDAEESADTTLRNLQGAMNGTVIFEPAEHYRNGFSDFVRTGQVRAWLARVMRDNARRGNE